MFRGVADYAKSPRLIVALTAGRSPVLRLD